MAGRPKLQELSARIERLGGDDYVFDRIAGGDPIGTIAKDLGVSRPYMYTWRDQKPEELAAERKARWEKAIELSADAKEEEGAEILDDLARKDLVTSPEVQLATSRAKYRQWQAETRNRTKFGGEQGVTVNVNLGQLHLDALRARGSAAALERARPKQLEDSDPVLEAEVIEDDGDVIAELKGS